MNNTFEIAIPVLNEEATLSPKISELHGFLAAQYPAMNWRIVIGDNGSGDNTLAIGKDLESRFPNVSIVSVGERGVGRALKYAWQRSQADILACMDLDLSTDLRHITESLDALVSNHCDLVYASRLHRDSQVSGRSFKRELTSRGFNFLIRKYLNVNISDGMCGFIFFKKEVFGTIHDIGIDNNRWFFQTELLVMAAWLKYRLYELPVKWTDDPNSKVKVVRLAWEYLQDMRLLRKRRKSILQHPR
jgi:glycosyltransferase involved in cell wall biosynthesis